MGSQIRVGMVVVVLMGLWVVGGLILVVVLWLVVVGTEAMKGNGS